MSSAAIAAPAADAKFTNGCVNTADKAANGHCHRPSFSANSRYMAFDSDASNLASKDKNDSLDIFVRDRLRGKTELISRPAKGGGTPDGVSFQAQISADGRFVAFVSVAQDLVRSMKPDKNKSRQVYVYDRKTHKTQLLSATPKGDPGNDDSEQPDISGDGSVVVFTSYAEDLVDDDSNGGADIFAWHANTGELTRVNVTAAGEQDGGPSGTEEPSISDDGNLVAFASGGKSTLAPTKRGEIYLKHLDTGALDLVSIGLDGQPGNDDDLAPAISGDGKFVVWASGGKNLTTDVVPLYSRNIFRRDLTTQTTILINENPDSLNYNPSISADGSKIAYMLEYDSRFTNLYVWDAADGKNTLATPETKRRGDDCPKSFFLDCGEVSTPVLSPDGSLLGFEGIAMNYFRDSNKYIQLLVSDVAD